LDKAERSLGSALGPIPCKASKSASRQRASFAKVVNPAPSKARRAGAASGEWKSAEGARSRSQMGQTGQSLFFS
jgi:hypothetical protein